MSHDKNIHDRDPDWHSSRRSALPDRGASASQAKNKDHTLDN